MKRVVVAGPADSATGEPLRESEFPLVTSAEGKRYELYSDGTFDEVEL